MHYFLVRYRLETIGMRATVLTVESGKRMTGLLVSVPSKCRPIPILTDTGEYRPIPDTGIVLTLNNTIQYSTLQ